MGLVMHHLQKAWQEVSAMSLLGRSRSEIERTEWQMSFV